MKKNSGQIVIFVLLIMLLALVVGLSVMSRTLVDLKSSSTSDQSSRAFTAAEAGIESALSTDLSLNPTGAITVNGIPVTYSAVANSGSFETDGPIAKDDVIQLDLTGGNGNFQVHWAKGNEDSGGCNLSDNGNAAIEITLYNSDYTVNKFAYNPRGCSSGQASSSNDFDIANAPGASNYRSKVVINPAGNAKMARIKPLYKEASIMVTGGNLPPQSYEITSRAVTANDVARVVQVTRSKPTLPPFFDYVLFGGNDNISQ